MLTEIWGFLQIWWLILPETEETCEWGKFLTVRESESSFVVMPVDTIHTGTMSPKNRVCILKTVQIISNYGGIMCARNVNFGL
jgi:hypothetical protein